MKKIFTFLIIGSTSLLFSCGDDDNVIITHEMGDWYLDAFITINLPSGYEKYNEGAVYSVSEITFGGLAIESYTLNLISDGSYNRSIATSGLNSNDAGSWLLEEDDFTLISDDIEEEEDFDLERNEGEQLWLSQSATFPLVKDAIIDTITSEYVDSLTDEEFEALFDPVSLDLVYAFERQQ